MDFSARATTKDADRSRRRRSCTPPRSSSTLPATPPGSLVLRHRRLETRGLAATRGGVLSLFNENVLLTVK